MISDILESLISRDKPRSSLLSVTLIFVLCVLAFLPFVIELCGFHGSEIIMKTAVQICVFILLAASYDILIGYTSVISLCHAVFFAVGAYSVGIFAKNSDPNSAVFFISILIGISISVVISMLISLIGLRVKHLFFTMITFAIASGAKSFVAKLSKYTGGLDGLTFDDGLPLFLSEKITIFGGHSYRIYAYYLIFFVTIVLFMCMLRLVNSPFGMVLKAIRENEFRTSAIGFNTNKYRIIAICIAGAVASIAGSMYASWIRIAIPNSYFNLSIMLTILIIVVVGGKGTIYGAVVGAVIIIIMENYLNPALEVVFQSDFPEKAQMIFSDPFSILNGYREIVPIRRLFNQHRWPLYVGVFYIACVYFFSMGIVGKLREWALAKMPAFSWLFMKNKILVKNNISKIFNMIYKLAFFLVFVSAACQIITGLFSMFDDNGLWWILSVILTYLVGCSGILGGMIDHLGRWRMTEE